MYYNKPAQKCLYLSKMCKPNVDDEKDVVTINCTIAKPPKCDDSTLTNNLSTSLFQRLKNSLNKEDFNDLIDKLKMINDSRSTSNSPQVISSASGKNRKLPLSTGKRLLLTDGQKQSIVSSALTPTKNPRIPIGRMQLKAPIGRMQVKANPTPVVTPETVIDLFLKLNEFPKNTIGARPEKMNNFEYIFSTIPDTTNTSKYILFISKHDLILNMADKDYDDLAIDKNAINFLMKSNTISILKKNNFSTQWTHNGKGMANFFLFLYQTMKGKYTMKYSDVDSSSEIMMEVLQKLIDWSCHEKVTKKLRKIIHYLQQAIDEKQSIEPYLPNDIQISPDFLNMFDFPAEHQFSIFANFDNLPGYSQLVYSFAEKVLHCPKIAFVSTSFNKIKTLGNGQLFQFNNLQYNHLDQNLWNSRNSFQNTLQLVFDDLVLSLCSFIQKHPSNKYSIDLEKEFVYHRVPYPHYESDDSDEEHKGEKLSAKVIVHSETITHSHDLQSLNAKNAVNDAIIHAYCRELRLHYTKQQKEYKILFCAETKAYQNFNNHTDTRDKTFDYVAWTKSYTKQEIRDAEFFLYVIYMPNHWIFYSFIMKDKKNIKCYCYDSLSKDIKVAGAKLRAAKWCIQNISEVYEEWNIDVDIHDNNNVKYEGQDFPQQKEDINCGIYTLLGVKEFLQYGDWVIEFNFNKVQSFKKEVRQFFKEKLREDYKRLEDVQASDSGSASSSSSSSDSDSVSSSHSDESL